MRSTGSCPRGRSHRPSTSRQPPPHPSLPHSNPQQNQLELALQTLDNTHALMLLQTLPELPPRLLCLKTRLAHLLNQHHLCLLFSSHSLSSTPLCPSCLEIYLQHVSENQENDSPLRGRLIEAISLDNSPRFLGFLIRLAASSPRVSRYRNFIENLRRDKCNLEKIEILEVHDNNRRIIAKSHIRRDQQILFIPKEKLITLQLARTLPLTEKIYSQRLFLKSPKHTQLAIFLLHQFQKGKASPFHHYLSTLPTDFSHFPIIYPEHLLRQLEGTCLMEQIVQKKLDLRKDYESVVSIDERFSRFTYERFVHMRLLVCSRVFGIVIDRVKTDAMVPLADMLNHHIPKQTSWYYCDRSRGFVIQSMKDIPLGAQIFDSYGQKCNSRFLNNYGFTLPSNLHNEVNIEIPLPFPCFPFPARLRVNRILDGKLFEEMMGVLRAAAWEDRPPGVEGEGVESLETVKQTHFLGIQNQIKAWGILEKVIADRLKEYPTSYWEDRKMMDRAEGIMKDVLTLRMGEKEVYQYYLTMARVMAKHLASKSKRAELAPYETYLANLELDRLGIA